MTAWVKKCSATDQVMRLYLSGDPKLRQSLAKQGYKFARGEKTGWIFPCK